MKVFPENPLSLRYECPKCATSFETRTFRNGYPRNWRWRGARQRFSCPACNATLRIHENFYLYFSLFALYLSVVVASGLIATFIIEEKMHVTFAMLAAMTLTVPLIVLAKINNKVECVDENT